MGVKLEFKLNPKQRQLVDSKVPWTAFMGGVGSGKSYAGAVRSLIAAIQEPGSLGVIASPTYTMLRDTTQRMFMNICPKEIIKSFNKNENHLTFVNGSEILFRSVDDPDKIRGLNLAWAWLDEGPLAGYYAWQMVKQRVGRQDAERFIRQAWVTGTPKGRDGYWKEFVKTRDEEHMFIQSSTHENAHNLPKNYADGQGLQGAFYQQEIMGSFEAFEGLVYSFQADPEVKDSHVMEIPTKKRYRRVVGGVDWGYTNPAVAIVAGFDGDSRAWIIGEFYQRYVRTDEHIAQILEFTREYHVDQWWCDPAEPEHIAQLKEAIDDAKLPCEVSPASNAIVPGIQTVQKFLSKRQDGKGPGLICDISCVYTISEFTTYSYPKKPEGNEESVINEKPAPKQNDHAVDSVRYILHSEFGINNGSAPIEVSNTNISVKKIQEVDWNTVPEDEDEWLLGYSKSTRQQNMRSSFHWLNNHIEYRKW